MNKTMKIISILLIAIMLVISLSGIASAKTPDAILNEINKATTGATVDTGITDLGGKVVATVQVIGIVVAVVILLVLGIKYMMGSASEKAEYKKTMIPYIVGAVLIFASTTIVGIVVNLASGLGGGEKTQ